MLLAKEDTVVKFIKVDLKDAAAGSERNNILRFFEYESWTSTYVG
jgi:hypothetical protein